MKQMFLMRGWPSCGKSYLAKQIQTYFHQISSETTWILSTDDYWGKEYDFDKTKLGVAHLWNQRKCHNLCSIDRTVIIDNTNTTWSEILPYLKIAKKFHYWVTEIIPNNSWNNNIEECYKRNTHGVPRETISAMKERFQYGLQSKIIQYLLGDNNE